MSKSAKVVWVGSLLIVILVSAVVQAAGSAKQRLLSERVRDLESIVAQLDARVIGLGARHDVAWSAVETTVPPSPAKPSRKAVRKADDKRSSDWGGACNRWTKPYAYKAHLRADYAIIAEVLDVSEVVSSARDACFERIDSPAQLLDCQQCVTGMIRKIYREKQ